MFTDLRSLWANRAFRLLITARFISNIGNGMAPIALAFGVLSLPGATATSLSYVTASQMVPIVVFLLIGGVMADRIGRAQMVGGTDVLGSLIVMLNGLLFITDSASVLHMCATGFVTGVLNALWYPAFSGLLPEVVETEQLQPANSLVGFSANIGFTIGASVAGILVSTVGPGWAFVTDGASYLCAGVLVWQLRSVSTRSPAGREESVVSQMRQGWSEFWGRRWLVVIAGSFAVVNMCFEAFLAVLAPLQMKESLGGARHMGFMMFA
ncbi:MAG: MFS transporter, partial [Actinomycetota bacterium]